MVQQHVLSTTLLNLAAEVFSTLHHLSDPVPDITGEHYRNFEGLYGTPTSEKYRPSMTEGGRKTHESPLQPNAQYARNVGMTMPCCECLKPRAFTPSTSSGFKMNYVCKDCSQIYFIAGSQLSDLIAEDSSPLHKNLLCRVFVRANLTCADKVEIPYYSSEVFEDVCIHCGNPDNIVKGDEVEGIQPTCDFCWNDESKTRILKQKRKQIQPTSNKRKLTFLSMTDTYVRTHLARIDPLFKASR